MNTNTHSINLPKIVQIGWEHHVDFCVWENRPLLLAKGVDMCDIESTFQSNQNEFVVNSLNIQSIKAKFDNFFAIINRLSSLGIFFGAICLQETWLTANTDLSLLQMPGYKLIHQGHICSKHGGLLIYLNDDFTYDQRTLYKHSDIWEGVFIDVSGPSLNRPLTISNIYRPPHDNNNN